MLQHLLLFAADIHHAPHLDGSSLSLLWVIPFIGILLSIALFPLLAPHFWHHHYGKVSLFWGTLFTAAFFVVQGWSMTLFYLLEVYLLEFIPFIALLFALFTIAGGIRLKGKLVGTPGLNTLILLIGTVLASFMGTTGAAMLLIRPLIRANSWRTNKVHIIVFFIFLVANIGGSLTPLGDPPLFLGFLKGVSFFWTMEHMFLPMVTASAILLAVFYVLDSYMVKRKPALRRRRMIRRWLWKEP
jgi:Na+/H+ antiporter NhaD/arsenite permease-like protein